MRKYEMLYILSTELSDEAKEEIVKLPLKSYQEIYKVFWQGNFINMIWTGIAGGAIGANKYVGLAVTLLETAKGLLKKIKTIHNKKDQ